MTNRMIVLVVASVLVSTGCGLDPSSAELGAAEEDLSVGDTVSFDNCGVAALDWNYLNGDLQYVVGNSEVWACGMGATRAFTVATGLQKMYSDGTVHPAGTTTVVTYPKGYIPAGTFDGFSSGGLAPYSAKHKFRTFVTVVDSTGVVKQLFSHWHN